MDYAGKDMKRLDENLQHRTEAYYTGILRAFVAQVRKDMQRDEMPDGWFYEDERELYSALPTFDGGDHVDGINVYVGMPRSDRRVGWYSFDSIDDFLDFAERMSNGAQPQPLVGRKVAY